MRAVGRTRGQRACRKGARHDPQTPLHTGAARTLPRRSRTMQSLRPSPHARNALGGRSRGSPRTRRGGYRRKPSGALLAMPFGENCNARRSGHRENGAHQSTASRGTEGTEAHARRAQLSVEEDDRREGGGAHFRFRTRRRRRCGPRLRLAPAPGLNVQSGLNAVSRSSKRSR